MALRAGNTMRLPSCPVRVEKTTPSTRSLKAQPTKTQVSRVRFETVAAKKGTKVTPKKQESKGFMGTLLSQKGNNPEWLDQDAPIVKSGTKALTKETLYIGKKKDIYQGNIGEPRYVTDVAKKYPDKEAYGPFGIFDNATGGWAGGEAGLKLMFLSAQTEKLKPGTKINVRTNIDIRAIAYSGLKGVVKSVDVGVNEVFVELALDDPEPEWETTAAIGAGVFAAGAIGANFVLVASIFGFPAMAITDALALGVAFGLYTTLLGRRTNGQTVFVPLECCFIPGVDKVSDPFWDRS